MIHGTQLQAALQLSPGNLHVLPLLVAAGEVSGRRVSSLLCTSRLAQVLVAKNTRIMAVTGTTTPAILWRCFLARITAAAA